jgi:hypothetical protein
MPFLHCKFPDVVTFQETDSDPSIIGSLTIEFTLYDLTTHKTLHKKFRVSPYS